MSTQTLNLFCKFAVLNFFKSPELNSAVHFSDSCDIKSSLKLFLQALKEIKRSKAPTHYLFQIFTDFHELSESESGYNTALLRIL